MAITPALTRPCSEKLLHAALTNQGDVLGYRDFGGPRDADDDEVDQSTESDQIDFMDELANDALGDRDANVLRHLLRTRSKDRMDPVTAALLIHMGVVPAAALILREAVLAQNVALDIIDAVDDDVVSRILGHRESWEIDLDTARGTHWSSEGTLLVDPMPETLAVAAAGRPLREVVAHPALDALDLTIERIETGPAASLVRLAGFRDDAMATLDTHHLEDIRKVAQKMAA